MVTDEERRAVVARLRDSAEKRMASKGKGNGNSWSWLYRSVFGYYMGTKKGAKGHYVEVAHRLADLIEPEPERTCEMVDNGRELCCSACDWRHDYDDEPVYCSGCGARVVSE